MDSDLTWIIKSKKYFLSFYIEWDIWVLLPLTSTIRK